MKEKYKLGWKVVRKDSTRKQRLVSAVAGVNSRVEYQTSRWTKPKAAYGPLCLFKTRTKARIFKEQIFLPGETYIYKCKYLPSLVQCVWNKYWGWNILQLPEGTVLADKVKLLYKA